MKIGCCRVSNSDQSTEPQEDELRRAGCEKVFRDVASSARASCPGLDEMIAHARKGDLIVVVRLDRLGRNSRDLLATVRTLERSDRGFKSLAENIDSTTAGGKLIFHIFASLAEFKRALIRERTLAGLAAARARGRVGGRPKNTNTRKQAMAMSLLADPANSVTDVCRLLKVPQFVQPQPSLAWQLGVLLVATITIDKLVLSAYACFALHGARRLRTSGAVV